VWILNVSRTGGEATGCPDGCATAGERGGGPLRVVSLNVLHGFPRFDHLEARLGLIAEEIRRQDADIVCLQEVPWVPQLGNGAKYLAERTGLNHLYLRANGNRWAILFEEGEAILSRYPLRDVSFAELEPRAGLFEHRAVLQATATTPWGSVRVFVTHLTNGDPEINRAQAASLQEFVDAQGEGLAIVAGDFNATEDTPQIQALAGQWLDVYPVVDPDGEGPTCCVGDVSQGPEQRLAERIDYVFLVPGAGRTASVVRMAQVLDQPSHTPDGWLWASDHVGLVAAIGIGR
jgi:endonuclease/exonuclease/phosphatase family metal-dependent hydrolase